MGQIVENKEPFCKPAKNAAYMDQGVSTPVANQKAGRSRPGNRNAAAGVGARNGANQKGSGKGTGKKNTAQAAPLTSAVVAVLNREGMVCGVFGSPAAARSFLQGGWA
ncbi:hypothetical protein ACQKJ1_01090 [Methylorubrum rhodesianum]|uniref:hypothetical protein n=1 Tax=Methylorubrum rhodesianum TaxID=29427 RepID=UPI003CFDE089